MPNHRSIAPAPAPAALTIPQFLAQVPIGRSKFYDLVNDGTIKILKLGRRTLLRAGEAERLLDSLEAKSA